MGALAVVALAGVAFAVVVRFVVVCVVVGFGEGVGCAYAVTAPAPHNARVPVARARLMASANSRFVLINVSSLGRLIGRLYCLAGASREEGDSALASCA
jgi:hypothetical protein